MRTLQYPFASVPAKVVSRYVAACFVIIALAEVYAEFIHDIQMVWILKPLVCPVLFWYYRASVEKVSLHYAGALALAWFASLLITRHDYNFMLAGAAVFLIHRMVVFLLAYRNVRLPGFFPVFLGAVPFLFAYLYLAFQTYEMLGDLIWLFLAQSGVTAFIGGIALANFMLFSDRPSRCLLISVMFSAATHFLYVMRFINLAEYYYESLTMLFFFTSHYFLCRFVILLDRRKEEPETI